MRAILIAIVLSITVAGCGTNPPAGMPGDWKLMENEAEEGEAMQESAPVAPVAKVVPRQLEKHGHVRTDNYHWLKERESAEVIDYLEAENDYTESALAHLKTRREELFDEIVGRIQQDDSTVPYALGDYLYYRRYREGGEYPIYCRRGKQEGAEEEILLDANRLAEGQDFLQVRGAKVSENHKLLAYAVDTVGRRLYTLRFRDLESGEDFADAIPNVTGNHVWAADNRTVFYTQQDPETLRWYRIYRHVLGTDPQDDVLVYEERDEEFSSFVYKTKSREFLVIGSEQTLSSEYRILPAAEPQGEFAVFQPREENHEYSVDHAAGKFYVRTNWEAKNFRLMAASVDATGKENWREVIAHRKDVYLNGVELFRDHMVVSEREDGLIRMRIVPWDGSAEHYLDFGEPAYLAFFDDNYEFDTGVLRYGYTSLTTPYSVFDYDMATRTKTLRKEDPVLGGFDKHNYVTERLWASARDGVRVPVSVVYRKGFKPDGTAPLLLYAYGSYGYSMDARFNSSRLSLLDRGFAYAIAHIRGGQELGRGWYEDGKLMKKMNTFTDFIDAGKHLVAEGYTSDDRLFAMGGSAGGLLMGAVANLAPELFHGIVSRVPFVDVVTTMLDPDIPLTTSEYDEWGNPNEREAYDYMLSYSPYDNLEAKDYPHMLITAGLHDSQVQYWEPAKYVAKLRTLKTGDDLLLLSTNMEAGHGGASGRFQRYRETALIYSFLLDLAGVKE